MKKIIIAGGTGLIGSAFISILLKRGDHLWVLSRNPENFHLDPSIDVVKWDARTPEGWGDLVEGIDAIVNLAGENIGAGRWTEDRKERILDSRVQAGKALVSALEKANHRPSVLLQASAVGYYGFLDDRIVTEETGPGIDYLAQVCVDWEATTKKAEILGTRQVLLRTGLVLDKAGGALHRLLLPFRLLVGGPLGNGKQWWPWISLEDQVNAMIFLLDHPDARGAFNLTAPQPVPMSEFGRILAKVLHKPYWLPVPAFALRILLGEMSLLVLKGQRAIPQRLLDLGYKFSFEDLHSALEHSLK
jgi:uncharacterized protein